MSWNQNQLEMRQPEKEVSVYKYSLVQLETARISRFKSEMSTIWVLNCHKSEMGEILVVYL